MARNHKQEEIQKDGNEGPMALRISQVVAGIILIHLSAEETRNLFQRRREQEIRLLIKNEGSEDTLSSWQMDRERSGKGAWTRILIRDVKPWVKRKWREVGNAMLHRAGKVR
ncbi:hypothetical protein Zmor_002235 [Zophobas morio]|uniref:Uncharacterized protein n=1 Tax=Zophobas morio TaxID=2755281 RepID=A0AA38MTB8_9CUCU|nr:hypothetical protein Zmor_002235 [Zophobas morio]